jgi:hypothetical protein
MSAPRSTGRPRRALVVAVAALVAVPLLSACGADDASPVPAAATTVPATLTPTTTPSPSASPVDIDPCSLVTTPQVREDLGGDVDDRQTDLSNPAVPTCTWRVSDSRLGTGTLRLAVTDTGGTATTFRTVAAAYPSATPVAGVGDKAYDVSPIGQVLVFRKGTTLTVAASGFTKDGADPDRTTTSSVLAAVATRAADAL